MIYEHGQARPQLFLFRKLVPKTFKLVNRKNWLTDELLTSWPTFSDSFIPTSLAAHIQLRSLCLFHYLVSLTLFHQLTCNVPLCSGHGIQSFAVWVITWLHEIFSNMLNNLGKLLKFDHKIRTFNAEEKKIKPIVLHWISDACFSNSRKFSTNLFFDFNWNEKFYWKY